MPSEGLVNPSPGGEDVATVPMVESSSIHRDVQSVLYIVIGAKTELASQRPAIGIAKGHSFHR